jgi:hypothetical protein
MTVEMKTGEAINEAFRAALVLTGSTEAAECAITGAIATLGSDFVGDTLLVETARSAIQHRTNFSEQPEAISMLPVELRRLFLLPSTSRDCFVLRVLLRLTSEVSAGILNLSKDEIDESVCEALFDLPRSINSIRSLL